MQLSTHEQLLVRIHRLEEECSFLKTLVVQAQMREGVFKDTAAALRVERDRLRAQVLALTGLVGAPA